MLCFGCFCVGMLFTDRMWVVSEPNGMPRPNHIDDRDIKLVSDGCDPRINNVQSELRDAIGHFSNTQHAMRTLDKTISSLEMELAAARTVQDSVLSGSPMSEHLKVPILTNKRRRDSIRNTWIPQGDKWKKLEEEKGIVICFVIGHDATAGGILDRAIEAEDNKHGDFLSMEHIEGYLELSAKTKTYFTAALKLWDADFHEKVDDDVHVNIGTLGTTLARHQAKPQFTLDA